MSENLVTCDHIRSWKKKEPILAVTAYDYTMARHFDEAGVDILHVGDSLGMVVLGFANTTYVTMDDMLRATEAVARARTRALITADLPYMSYETAEQALSNAVSLIESGADAVKMEGGREISQQVQAVRTAGIEVQGHLGMLPQHILEEGTYKKKGKQAEEIKKLLLDAQFLESQGAFSIVLEAVVESVAAEITQALEVPTIGIASGSATTGQIQVCTDLLGLTPWWKFPHVQPQAQLSSEITKAIHAYRANITKRV
jgi:3-methyl-2-oxobutanoate hydroxymethyltransferase